MSTNTVFVIGAGASKEVNLPTGKELKKQIARLVDIQFDFSTQKSGDYVIKDALLAFADNDIRKLNTYLTEACWHIKDALPLAISIDNFIDAHRGNKKIAICSKLAIVRAILDAEKKSLLYIPPRKKDLSYRSLEDTWYLSFFQILTENCEAKELQDRFKSISLVIFNYDRCIEHFLYHALQKYYQISKEEAGKLVKQLNIYHPYGNVGSLPWYGNGKGISFGDDPHSSRLLELSQKIKTFTEGTNPEESEIQEIKNCFYQADKVVFLGFAFHKLNMQVLTPKPCDTNQERKCYATTFDISDNDKEVIEQQIKNLYGQQNSGYISVNMANLTCHDFFTEFWRSLTF